MFNNTKSVRLLIILLSSKEAKGRSSKEKIGSTMRFRVDKLDDELGDDSDMIDADDVIDDDDAVAQRG